jgi:choice-of-anchor B domain-containing protein
LISVLISLLIGGLAAPQPAAGEGLLPENVILLKQLDRGETYSGNWGYTSPEGIELAISGTRNGTTFIDATDPVNAYEVAFIPGPFSIWREMATYGPYCYIVTEAAGAAIQVVSLVNPLAPVLVSTLNPPDVPFTTAHEIKIDQQTGYLYAAGTRMDAAQSGMVILDLTTDTRTPQVRGIWTAYYAHDLSLLNGRAYVAAINSGRIVVLDVTNPGTPPILGEWTYPGAVPHNTWPTPDGSFLVSTDETSGGHLRMWDITDLSLPEQTDEWISPTGAIVHNAYLRGDYCYMSHYSDGLRVVDAADPYNLLPVGWYDTGNAWGAYCFAADPTIVYISDIENGTFILRFVPPPTAVEEGPPPSAASPPLLLGSFPNPFRHGASIRFHLPRAERVSLRIYDAGGRRVRELAEGMLPSGGHAIAWDGRNDDARPVAAGVYYYRLEAAGFSESQRLVLAR